MRTQVGIIGAGPAGLLLARILKLAGVDSVVLERRDRKYILGRIRAGVLEQGTIDMLREYGAKERIDAEGLSQDTMQIRWQKRRRDVPTVDERGRRLTTYGQSKVVEDLLALNEDSGVPILFGCEVASLEDLLDRPRIRYVKDGETAELSCDFVAGCDGFRGVSRSYIPGHKEASFQHDFPFGWLGIMADAKMSEGSRGFAHHPDGLAVSSARGPHTTRLYLQKPWDFDMSSISDDEIWSELEQRLDDGSGHVINRGPIIDKGFARLRAFVCEKMQYGRLAIAGDAAHIVPPSGAKGLNLAVGDIRLLSAALLAFIAKGDRTLLDTYTERALKRVWPTVHWSCLMSEALHMFPGQTDFDTQRQYQTLRFWCETEIGQKRFRDAMLGLPYYE